MRARAGWSEMIETIPVRSTRHKTMVVIAQNRVRDSQKVDYVDS